MPKSFLQRALEYAANGHSILPLHGIRNGKCTCSNGSDCGRPGKHPRTPNGVNDATMDERVITRWWDKWPDANIGVATGKASKLLVLDVDGSQGQASLLALERQHKPLPKTVTVVTGNGRHIYFAIEDLATTSRAGALGPNLDHRGDGGYVVAAGSAHISGVRYRYDSGLGPKQVEIATAPSWLMKLVRARSKEAADPIPIPSGKRARARRYVETALARELERVAKAPMHQRNDTLNRAAFRVGQVLPYGLLDEGEVKSKLSAVAEQIGLDLAEIELTLRSGLTAGQQCPRRLPFVAKDLVRKRLQKARTTDTVSTDLAKLGENDADNAQRFVRRFGEKLLWTPGRGWLVYDGKVWKHDATNEVNRLAEATARAIAEEASCLDRETDRSSRARFAAACLSRAAISNMIELARPLLAADDSAFDRDPWLLNTNSGTVDLRTGEQYANDPRDLLTKIAPTHYSRTAECPKFVRFLQTTFGNDDDVIAYVQRVLGYALTGTTKEQVFFALVGAGRNGKSTLMNLFRDLLGDYGVHTPTETLMVRQHDNGVPNDLARLVGKRMVTAAETNWNRQMDEAKLKAMTGGEPITARFLRQEFFEFVPQFKLFIAANDFPRVRSTAHAFWRRVVVVPFSVQIDEADVDPDLQQKLRDEASGILAWAVKGCLNWQKQGLKPPQSIKSAVKVWQQSVDHVERFHREELLGDDENVVPSSLMFQHYKAWCAENGETPLTTAKFAARLRDDLNVTHKRTKRGSEWRGVKFRLR